jgi:hypothetical protein
LSKKGRFAKTWFENIWSRGPITAYLLIIAFCVILGMRLEQVQLNTFTEPTSALQASVIAFVPDPTAIVSLNTRVFGSAPWHDEVAIHVTNAPGRPKGWLVIIECPPILGLFQNHSLLYSELPDQPAQFSPVLAVRTYAGTGSHGLFPLGCFPPPDQAQSLSTLYQSLTTTTLPELETDDYMKGALGRPTLYAQQGRSVGPLVRVFAGAAFSSAFLSVPCPSPAASSSPSTSSSSPGTVASNSAPQSPSPTQSPASSSPSGGPGCYQQPSARFTAYYVPSRLQVTEILDGNLGSYQIDSVTPAPSILSRPDGEETIQWTGVSSLSPSWQLTNRGEQQAVSRDAFYAGILLGVAAGFIPALIDKAWATVGSLRKEAGTKKDVTAKKSTSTAVNMTGEEREPTTPDASTKEDLTTETSAPKKESDVPDATGERHNG